MNDILLDTNLAKHLINPVDEEYLKFFNWLNKEGALVLSNKLIAEYGRGNQNLLMTVNELIKKGKVKMISNSQLKKFIIPKKIENKLLCNYADKNHLKALLLSNRKLGIIDDNNLRKDINSYPKIDGVQPKAENSPDKINYQ